MATTHIEFEKIPWIEGEKPKAPSKRELIEKLKEKFEFVYRDYDKAGDPDDAAYYAGQIDTIHEILVMFGWRRKMENNE